MTFTTIDSRRAAPSLMQRLALLRRAVAERIAQARDYRATVAELSALLDHDLADINLHRSLIADMAAQAARRA